MTVAGSALHLGPHARLALCISWPLFVLLMCFAFGTSLPSRSCGCFCAHR